MHAQPQCFLCESLADTRDHIPPRGFFPVVPDNIVTVPACLQCNQSYSKDEEYFRTVVAAQCYATSPVARQVWSGTIVRSLWRRGFEGLRRRPEPGYDRESVSPANDAVDVDLLFSDL